MTEKIAQNKKAIQTKHVPKNDNSFLQLVLSDLSESARRVSVSAHVHRDGGLHLSLTEKTSGNCDQKDITLWSEK